MKKLFILLLVLNILLFLKEYFLHSPEAVKVSGDAARPVERLVLFEEAKEGGGVTPKPAAMNTKADSAQAPEQKGATTRSPSLAGNGLDCLRIGPFQDVASAHIVADKLSNAGLGTKLDIQSRIETHRYWLMYPPEDTIEDARFALAKLKDKGLRDLWLFETGPWRGAISLGVFETRQRAEQAANMFKQKGIEVKVMPMQRQQIQHWVHVDRPLPANLRKTLLERYPQIKIQRERCGV